MLSIHTAPLTNMYKVTFMALSDFTVIYAYKHLSVDLSAVKNQAVKRVLSTFGIKA